MHIKFLLGNKLNKPINVESHSASKSATKEFERLGGSISIVKFVKSKSLQSDKPNNNKNKNSMREKISKKPESNITSKNKAELERKTDIQTRSEPKTKLDNKAKTVKKNNSKTPKLKS